MQALCRQDANLLIANTTLQFLLENLGSGTLLHDKMRLVLTRRISERLTELSNVLQYLHNGTFVDSSLGLRKISKDNLVKTIVRLLNRTETENEEDLNNVGITETHTEYGPVTLKQKLQQAIGNNLFLDFCSKF